MIQLPKDPVLLLSVVNTKLRDYYESIEALCEDMEEDEMQIKEALKQIDYEYERGRNQFI